MATGNTLGSTKKEGTSLGEAPAGDTLGTGGGGSTFGTSTTPSSEAASAGAPITGTKTPGLYGAGGVKSQQDVLSTTLPTGPQQVEALLAPYVKELTTLGPEYQQEMNFLAPYLSPAHQENFQQVLAGSVADESPTGSKSVAAADQAAGNAILNAQAPGFAQEAAAGKQAQQAAPYEGQINTALAYQKYLATYGGQPVNTTDWPTDAAQAYQAVMGTSGGSGLPSITNAAAAGQANANLTATQGQTGSPATGY